MTRDAMGSEFVEARLRSVAINCYATLGSDGGASMHIHLPKPVHGWREFVGEVGIIVIGILIALGAEQAVENLHRRSQVREMTAKLRDESIENRHVTEFDLRTLQGSVGQIDQKIAALNSCRGTRSVDLAPLKRTFMLVPSDAAWIGIRDSALLPLMPDRLSDNYWKIDTVGKAIGAATDSSVEDYSHAAGAVEAVRGGATGEAICGQALLELNQLKQQELMMASLVAVFRDANEQALRGERIDKADPTLPRPY